MSAISFSNHVKILRTNPFYDAILTYFASYQGLAHLAEAYNCDGSKRWAKNESCMLVSIRRRSRIHFLPAEIMPFIAKNSRPPMYMLHLEEFELSLEEEQKIVSKRCRNGGSCWPFFEAADRNLILGIFEQYKHEIREKFGNNVQGWPEVWQFASVVRDAITHDGKLKFKKGISDVHWRGLAYNREHEGNEIIECDFSGGDLPALVLDMENHLSRLPARKLVDLGWCSKEEADFWALAENGLFATSNICDANPQNIIPRMVRS